jgi:hypothetical protein
MGHCELTSNSLSLKKIAQGDKTRQKQKRDRTRPAWAGFKTA